MFYRHLKLIKQGMVRMFTKDFMANIDAFDEMEKEALEMADTLTNAIIMQFPYKCILNKTMM